MEDQTVEKEADVITVSLLSSAGQTKTSHGASGPWIWRETRSVTPIQSNLCLTMPCKNCRSSLIYGQILKSKYVPETREQALNEYDGSSIFQTK